MTAVPYWHVDAFADRPFAGNQAAVMILEEWAEDAVLQAIGAENNFAETAFLVRDFGGEADWELRWFTPAVEIRLCGHATLAAGHVVLERDGCDVVTFRPRRAGVLEVRRRDAGYELALPAIHTELGEWGEAHEPLGGVPREVWRSPDRYSVFVFADEDEVRALAPDFAALAALGGDEQFIATAPGRDADVVSRVFVPGAGVDEDSVTGSAHAVLTSLWAEKLGRASFTAFQASARGGNLCCRLERDRAWLGGDCVTVVEGTFRF